MIGILRTQKITLLFILCVLHFQNVIAKEITSGSFSYKIDDKPSWITKINIPENNSYIDQSVQYLLIDGQLNLTQERHEHFIHNAQRVVSEGGLEQSSKFSFSFQPDYQSISLHEIVIYREGLSIDVMSSANIQLIRRETEISSNIYNGYVDLVIVVPDVRVGDTIEYSATIKGNNPVFGRKNFAKFPVGWQVPILESYVRVVTDKKRALNSKVHGVQGTILATNTDGFIEYVWSQKNVSPVLDEQEYPSLYNPYPYIEFSEYENWAQVVSWAEELYPNKQYGFDELDAYIQNLQDTSDTNHDYIEKAIQFVQNEIRYFGIEIGVNSHMPSLPSTVFSRRYGDCKDKTMLLNYFLKKVGVNAYPALVSTYEGGAIINHLPSPGSFNHVISYFELEGVPYWIDGTKTYQYGKLSHIGIGDFQKALLIRENEKELMQLNLKDKHRSRTSVSEKFIAQDSFEKPVNMELTIVMSSHEAEYVRSVIANQSLKDFSKSYLNFYGQHFPTIKALDDLQIVDDRKNNQITIKGQYVIDKYWELNQPQIYTDFFGEFISSYIQLPKTIDRTLPLAIYHPAEVVHKISFLFPEEINWVVDVTPIVITNSALDFRRNITKNGKEIETIHIYKSVDNIVEVKDIPEHISNLKKIRNALYLTIYAENKHNKSNIRNVLRSLLKKKKASDD
jgi:transglutaminase-like putative cysteine protease